MFNQEIEQDARDLNFQFHKKFPIKFSGYWFKKLVRRGLDYSSLGQRVDINLPVGVTVPFQPAPQLADKYYASEAPVSETQFARTRGQYEVSKAVAYSGLLWNGMKLLCRTALYDDKIFSELVVGRYKYGFDAKIPVLDSTGRIVTSTIPLDNFIGGIIKSKIQTGQHVQTMLLGFGRESNSTHNWVTSFRMGYFSKYPDFETNHYTMIGRRILDVLPRSNSISEYVDPFKREDPEVYQMKDFRLLCLTAVASVQQISNVYTLILNHVNLHTEQEERFENEEFEPMTTEKTRKLAMKRIDSEKEIKNTMSEYEQFKNNKRIMKMSSQSIDHIKAVNSLIHTLYNVSKN
jgi:hypothetical protein